MSTPSTPPPSEAEPTDALSTWDEVRRVADELELHIHLAGMNARDRWRALEPRLAALERWFARSSERAGAAITKELSTVGALIRKLRADIGN